MGQAKSSQSYVNTSVMIEGIPKLIWLNNGKSLLIKAQMKTEKYYKFVKTEFESTKKGIEH